MRNELALVLLALSAACAAVPADAGFAEVADLARARDGQELVWRRGGPEDEALDERVRALAAEELDEERAVAIALLNNHRLQALYAELGFAQADLLEAARIPNPLLHAELRFPEGGGRSAFDLGLEQEFLSILWRPLKQRMAAEAFEAVKLRTTAGALTLATEVRAAFRRLQGSQQLLELARTALEAAEAALELSEHLEAAGNVRALDVALERLPREEARLAVADAELALLEAREALARRLGLHGAQAELRVGARLPDPPAEAGERAELEARAVEQSLELAALRHEIERVGARLGLADAMGPLAMLELGVVGEREGEGHWELGPSAALPLPLFSQGQPARRAARAELERLRSTYLAEAIELRSEVRRAGARVVALHARATFMRGVLLPLHQDVLAGLQLDYNAMQEGAFRLLLAKRAEIAAAASYVATLRDYWMAECELDGLLAGARLHPSSSMPSPASLPSPSTPEAH